MKFLPVQYREQMNDFFGKRGRSWHISAVITRATVESKHEVECFVHIFNNCTQNSFAVLSITEDLLVTSAYLRSDNAGCYQSGPLLLRPVSFQCSMICQKHRQAKTSVIRRLLL